MDNNIQHGFENVAANTIKITEETRKIKKVSNLIGAVYIIVWMLPGIINGIITDTAKLFGLQTAFAKIFSDPAFLMVYQTVFSALVFTLPFLILPKGTGNGIGKLLCLKRPNKNLFVPFILIGAGVSAFANIITNNIGMFFDSFGVSISAPDIEYPQGIFGFILSFIAIAVTPALTEEFATRGMVMGSAKEFGEGFALIASATFFSLMHGNLVQIPFAFIMGIVIAFAVLKTGSVITGMAIHFVNNAISVLMAYTLDLIESIILQNVISAIYFGICAFALFFGISIAQNKDKAVWSLEKSQDTLTLGTKLKYFFFSPTIIISIALTVIDCIGTVSFR